MTNQSIACPKWTGCNAPVCPLDPSYRNCKTHKGEAVCLWLREAVKEDGMERIPVEIAPKIREALPVLLVEGGAVLRAKLNQAAQSGSKVIQGRSRGTPAAGVPASGGTVTSGSPVGKQQGCPAAATA